MENNYLFIGGAGFIGSCIIRTLIGQNETMQNGSPSVTVLEPPHADISRIMGCNVRLVRGTLQDTELIGRLIDKYKVGTVVHLASAMTPSSDYSAYMSELYNVARPSIRLMDLCAARNVRLVYFSSGGAVYGESEDRMPHKESDPLKPVSYYGLSKLLIETNIRFEHRVNGLQYLILRPSNIYGPGQRSNGAQGLIANALSRIQSGQPVTVWGDGSAVRDYIYIDDAAKAVCAVMRSCAANEAINIGSGEGLAVKDVLSHINDVVAAPVIVQYDNARKSDVRHMVLDVTRMRQIFFMPMTKIREGIRMAYTEMKDD